MYIFFYPQEQVKSADPVTYDESGNVIPLSERFNAANEDIRYSHRSDYQYTVDGARDFFGDDGTYHHFAKKASETIAKNPRKKLHIVSVTQYDDDIFMCAVVNDGNRKFHLEDVAFIDVSEYNGRISTLIDQFERMYVKYGKERASEFLGSVASDVRGRFFPVDRGRSNRTTQTSENRPRKEYYFESDGGDAGERDQRSGVPEGNSEVTDSSDGIEIDDDTESAYPTQKSIRTWAESDYVAHRNETAERLAKTIGVSVKLYTSKTLYYAVFLYAAKVPKRMFCPS